MNVKFKKTFSKEQLTTLADHVNNLNVNDITDKDLKVLCYILITTDYPLLRDYIAIKLKKLNNEKCLPYLISAIKLNLNTKHINFLIDACQVFDCSKYIDLFTNILILKTDSSFLEACWVIENMKYIKKEDQIYSLNKLKLFYEMTHKFEDYKLGNALNDIIYYIDSFVFEK